MKYFVSAFRAPDHPQGAVKVDRMVFETVDDALAWTSENAARPRDPKVPVPWQVSTAPAGLQPGIYEMIFSWPQTPDDVDAVLPAHEVLKWRAMTAARTNMLDMAVEPLDGVTAVIIEREDRAALMKVAEQAAARKL